VKSTTVPVTSSSAFLIGTARTCRHALAVGSRSPAQPLARVASEAVFPQPVDRACVNRLPQPKTPTADAQFEQLLRSRVISETAVARSTTSSHPPTRRDCVCGPDSRPAIWSVEFSCCRAKRFSSARKTNRAALFRRLSETLTDVHSGLLANELFQSVPRLGPVLPKPALSLRIGRRGRPRISQYIWPSFLQCDNRTAPLSINRVFASFLRSRRTWVSLFACNHTFVTPYVVDKRSPPGPERVAVSSSQKFKSRLGKIIPCRYRNPYRAGSTVMGPVVQKRSSPFRPRRGAGSSECADDFPRLIGLSRIVRASPPLAGDFLAFAVRHHDGNWPSPRVACQNFANGQPSIGAAGEQISKLAGPAAFSSLAAPSHLSRW